MANTITINAKNIVMAMIEKLDSKVCKI